MPKKPSKNSLCSCGSGKKYRKCSGKKSPSVPEVKEVVEIFQRQEAERQTFTERYGHVRPPQAVRVGGKIFTILEGGIYSQIQKGPYNFVNSIHDHALHFFGIDYLEHEEKKPFNQRNTAIQWMHSYVDYMQELKRQGKNAEIEGQVGVGAAWFRFAYDLFTIRDNAKVERRLKERLLVNRSFQSARYELWVASICITAGFDLDFEDETDTSTRHPEFIATDRYSPAKITVEAKSRHRRGVQGFVDGADVKPGIKVGIRGIVLDGYKKSSAFPLYIFVDVNLPPVEKIDVWQRWMHEIDVTMSDLAAEGYADPCPANIVFFTNDPSHYVGTGRIGNDSDKLWMKYFEAKNPRVCHPETDICGRLLKAYEQRRSPPENFPEFR
jgi:hypothetical protein